MQEVDDAFRVVGRFPVVEYEPAPAADGTGHIEPGAHTAIDAHGGPSSTGCIGAAQVWAENEGGLVRIEKLKAFFLGFFLVRAGSRPSTGLLSIRPVGNHSQWAAGG